MSSEEVKKPLLALQQSGPGPKYMLSTLTGYDKHDCTKFREPAYTMRPKLPVVHQSIGPGPKYNIPYGMTRSGAYGAPQYSVASRVQPFRPFNVPGPPTYRAEEVPPMRTNRAPEYSLSSRTPLRKENTNPGPNKYKMPGSIGVPIPDKRTAPAFVIGIQTKPLHTFVGPSAAQYPATAVSLYKTRPPEYTATGRNFPPRGGSMSPGPGAYLPTYNLHNEPPSFSLGIKHSPYKRLLILEADNA